MTATGLDHLRNLFGAPPRADAPKDAPKSAEAVAALIIAAGRARRAETLTDAEKRILNAARPEPEPAHEKVDAASLARFIVECGRRRRGEL